VISYLLGREAVVDRGLEVRTAVEELSWGERQTETESRV